MKREPIIGKYTLESLTTGMYSSPLDMYREYIQNAVDSFDKAISEEIENAEKLVIDINIDKDSRSVVIRDNGCGIRTEEAIATLLDIGNSRKDRGTSRGFRGIGRLAGLSYCDKLIFRTSSKGEEIASVIEFDAKYLKELLLPGADGSMSVEEVIDQIVTTRTEKETSHRRYFQVELEGVWDEAGLIEVDVVKKYLLQIAPIHFSEEFKWGRTVLEKVRLCNYTIPQYTIRLNGVVLYKPYMDTLISDRVKKNLDTIHDIKVEAFYRKDLLSAVLWYAETNFYGTILDNEVKGLRIRQGNILIGDKSSCNFFFKEERFNGWMIGELHVIDPEIIVNSRRDNFERNSAYFDLVSNLKDWALEITKTIRHLSYERSLSASHKAIAEAENIEDLPDENSLCTEDLSYAEDFGESISIDHDESFDLAETDYISKLGFLLNQKKAQTKYTALNINQKLTIEQRKVLERVFDLITQEYDQNLAERFVNTISEKF